MALELTLTSAQPAGKADIQTPVQKLLVKVVVTHAAAQFPNTVAAALAAVQGYIPDAYVEVTRQSKLGAKPILQRMKIRDLAEIAANNEGYIYAYQNATFTQSTILFTIELSNIGALRADGTEFVTVTCDSFAAANTTTTISSLSAPVVTGSILRYKAVACQANAAKQVNIADAYAVMVPNTMTNVDLVYPGAPVVTLKGGEMENLAADVNDVVYNIEGRSYAYLNWRIIPAALAEQARFTLSADGNVYLLINEEE